MRDTLHKTSLLAALALATTLGACAPGAQENLDPAASTEDALATQNGLTMVNGLSMTNGLSGNGLSGNGLSGNGLLMNPLKTGILPAGTMMNTPEGRATVSYIVRCALASGKTITAKDSNNVSYNYTGAIGVAPEWELGTCNTTCQERMSACLLAHVNTSGVHIPIWLDGEGAIGWGQNTSYPYQEGSFFGNIFVNPPKGYFCNGDDFSAGTVPGRLGAGQSYAPYYDPFGTPGPCSASCTKSSATTNGKADGYSTCYGYTHVVTVWRNFDVNTQYRICNRQIGKCLEVPGSSSTAGTGIQFRTYSGASNQKWTITQTAAGKYKVVNVATGKALDTAASSIADGAAMVQQSYGGTATQQWAIKSIGTQGDGGNYLFAPSTKTNGTSFPPTSTLDGAPISVTTYTSADIQKWQITPL